ncbi:MAG: HAMP domain-containing histidine kinase [Candidatus Omnitrophica bacterium]|nr:HAMP domain-containing histidine kinase [Candidatus Omnitrophota bacterium]
MKIRFVIPLILLILTPLGLLAWLGVLLASQERASVEERYVGLIREDLQSIALRIDRMIEDRERKMLSAIDDYLAGDIRIEDMGADNPTVSEPFLLDSSRDPVYPKPGQGHDAFLNRTVEIWGDPSLFRGESGEGETQVLRAGRILDSNDSFGWETWYWNRGMNFLFWRALPDGGVIGFEVNRARLIADIIEELPDTHSDGRPSEEKQFRLIDSQGKSLYQWGAFTPEEGSDPIVSNNLEDPLSSWSLQVFAPSDYLKSDGLSSYAMSLWLGLIAVGLGLLAVGYLVIREYTREMREAEQRVTFVNQVSHELKTPLTNIRMYAELLQDEIAEESPSLAKKTRIIAEESGRLSRLIGNILTFSRKERAKLQLHFSKGVLDETIRATLDQFRPLLTAKGIEIDLDLKTPDNVYFDSDAVGQMVGNLLSNVEKYCHPKSRVSLTTFRKGANLVVEIADNGPGISKSEREKIFRPFYRVSNELTDGVTGTGIGLSISRDLARMHGGDLILLPSDTGSHFRITIQIQSIEENRGS